ncbi:MAG: aminopeptidase P family protein [Phycisphaerae bacterium]|nr:aminopeptidase P family protein [Phycisphaerae bacterium]
MNHPSIEQHAHQIQKLMKRNRAECLLLTNPANVTYATGFLGHDSWAAVTPHQVYLLTDSRYVEQAEKECPYCRIMVRSGSMAQLTAGLCQRLRSLTTLHVEDSITCASFLALRKAVSVSVRTTSLLEGLRSVKDPWEYKITCQAVRLAIAAFEHSVQEIQPGMREFEVAALLDYHIHKQGATNAFDTIVAFGPNGSRPHHRPGSRRLKANDTILMDFGARTQGYCSDITRSFSIGRAPRLFNRVYDIVRQAQQAAIAIMGPGVKLSDVDHAARSLIQMSGFPVYSHGTGHGIGLDIHEAPTLNPNVSDTLKSGQIVTIEPGIYLPGKLGIRLEEDVMITARGTRVLTGTCPHFPTLEAYQSQRHVKPSPGK